MKAEANHEAAISRKVKTTGGDIEGFNRKSWNYMKRHLNLDDQKLVRLNAARCPARINSLPAYLFRYFNIDDAQEKGLTIADYESLNDHPELILYEGYRVLSKGGELIIKKRDSVGASLLEEKLQKGEITDVGVVIEKSAAMKFLGGFGKFLAMGGFMIVLVVVLGIVIAISLLTKSC